MPMQLAFLSNILILGTMCVYVSMNSLGSSLLTISIAGIAAALFSWWIGRLYVKVLLAEEITKAEAKIASDLIKMDSARYNASVMSQIRLTLDTLVQNPSTINLGNYVVLDKHLLLGKSCQRIKGYNNTQAKREQAVQGNICRRGHEGHHKTIECTSILKPKKGNIKQPQTTTGTTRNVVPSISIGSWHNSDRSPSSGRSVATAVTSSSQSSAIGIEITLSQTVPPTTVDESLEPSGDSSDVDADNEENLHVRRPSGGTSSVPVKQIFTKPQDNAADSDNDEREVYEINQEQDMDDNDVFYLDDEEAQRGYLSEPTIF
ncbi:unnamed protein product [Allacma fusca]|uniref:Uncharacterized protein n=1 Tax=Allacma fusca TaxID=39272 RepID=A0A8J2P5D3_9HEXA|nr:unnamed protein product [Allacma fusca]